VRIFVCGEPIESVCLSDNELAIAAIVNLRTVLHNHENENENGKWHCNQILPILFYSIVDDDDDDDGRTWRRHGLMRLY